MGSIAMDTLHNQITMLNQKMDALFQAIEELSRQISNAMAEVRATSHHTPPRERESYSEPHSRHHHILDEIATHKDILLDSNTPEMSSSNSDRVMSPELQIQRLTAQLTAAYNRIAALEEQLLSRRIS